MMDFGKWFDQSAKDATKPSAEEVLDGMGLRLGPENTVFGKCSRCEREICWTDYIDFEEILKDGVGHQLCGGTEHCIP